MSAQLGEHAAAADKEIDRRDQKKQVDQICQFPYKIQGHDTAHKDHQDIDCEVQSGAAAAEQVFKALPPEEAPSHQCCQSEADNGDGQYFIPEEGQLSEGGGCEGAGRKRHPFAGIFQLEGYEDEAGYGAENYGVPEGGAHGDQRLIFCLIFR